MNIEVWCFYPNELTAQANSFIAELRRHSHSRGWQFVLKPTKRFRVSTGRMVHLLEPRDAVALYKRVHRAHVATLRLSDAQLCTHPDRDFALDTRKVVSLAQYVLYKAYSVPLHDWNVDPASWIADFQRWSDSVECEGEHDPRCLPFHIFRAPRDDARLFEKGARDAFNNSYGAGQVRTDAQQLIWSVDKSYHGTEELHVAGRKLQRGFHWDVRPLRSGGRAGKTIHTPLEAWEIRDRINVTPDAGIRGGRPAARRTHP